MKQILFIILLLCVGCKNADTIGKSGSMARMNIVGDYLYTVNSNTLVIHNIEDAKNPQRLSEIPIETLGRIETLWPETQRKKLFLGSTAGMYIYDITNPATPQYLSKSEHFRSCDPVVVNGDFAYITLRNGTNCGLNLNQLQIVNISNIFRPKKMGEFPMTHPMGLAVDDQFLFIADDESGLKIYDKKNPVKPILIYTIDQKGTRDLILDKPYLYLSTEKNISIYRYDTLPGNPPLLLSQLKIEKTYSTKTSDFFADLKPFQILTFCYISLAVIALIGIFFSSNPRVKKFFKFLFIGLVGLPVTIILVGWLILMVLRVI